MGKKRKTRFTVSVKTHIAELFSVRELADKSLNITLPHGLNYEEPEKPDVRILRTYVSVHLSTASTEGGTTIKRTTHLADGRELTMAALVIQSKKRLIWPLLFAREVDLSLERRAAKIKDKDTVVHIADMDVDHFTLYYVVFISRNGISLWEPDDQNVFTMRSQEFELFTLWVYWSLIPLPSTPFGHHVLLLTSALRVDKVPEWETAPGGAIPFEEADVELFVMDGARAIGTHLVNTILNDEGAHDLPAEQLARLTTLATQLVKVSPI